MGNIPALRALVDVGVTRPTYLRAPSDRHAPLHVRHPRWTKLTFCGRPRRRFVHCEARRGDDVCLACLERALARAERR